MTFDEIVFERRTAKVFNGQPVPKKELEKLLDWAVRAPNHRLSEPWRFYVLESPAIKKYLHFLRSELKDLPVQEPKLSKMEKLGGLIFVTINRDQNDFIHRENYAAAAAAIQNILLGASSLKILSFWSTSGLMSGSETKTYLGYPDCEEFVGALWLGYGELPSLKPRKPASELTRWFS